MLLNGNTSYCSHSRFTVIFSNIRWTHSDSNCKAISVHLTIIGNLILNLYSSNEPVASHHHIVLVPIGDADSVMLLVI